MENKQKHLEFATGAINRMAQNSFLIKGWTVTLVAGLFALAAKDTKQYFLVIAYFPTLMFWLLDSYYLYQERLFRDVYNHVRAQNENEVDYSLSTELFDKKIISYGKAAFSVTMIFYLCIISTLLLIMFCH